MDSNVNPILLTIPNATAATSISRTRLYALMGDGTVEAVKVGKRTLIKADSLKAYIGALPAPTIRPTSRAVA